MTRDNRKQQQQQNNFTNKNINEINSEKRYNAEKKLKYNKNCCIQGE